MKKLLLVILAVFLVSCGRSGGEYIGKWQTEDGKRTMEISRNGDNLLLKITEPSRFSSQPDGMRTTTFSGTVKDGLLKVDVPLNTVTITYLKDHNTLLVPKVMGGNFEYKHVN